MSNTDSSKRRRFAIALSFPGERREYVEQVANALLPAFGGEQGRSRIFYDAWHESSIIGIASNRKLQSIYATDSDLIVPFFCEDYRKKKWCGVELRAIEELLFEEEFDRLLPFRFDHVQIPGTFKQDIFPIVSERSAEDVAQLILDRYRQLHPGRLEEAAPHGHRRSAAVQADISRIMKYAPSNLIGREAETKVLSDAWDLVVRGETKRPHILTFVALGGEGKTSVVAKWAVELAFQGWPGCEAVLAWSFYSQGTREQLAASSDLFLNEALSFFGDAAMGASAAGSFDKGRRLVQLVGERRALLILDGLEPLQYAPTSPQPGELKDQGISTLLKGLAANNKGLCVVTTRYSVTDLRAYWQTTAPDHELKSLTLDAGVDLLKKLGVRGTQKQFEALVDDVDGHALTLNLLGGFLKRAFKGDIRQRDRVKFEKANEKIQGGHAFRAMAAYEEWLLEGGEEGRREVAILRLLGLFDRPADAGCINALRGESIPNFTEPIVGLEDDDWEFSLTGLENAKLLTVNRDEVGTLLSLDAHPLLREYFARQLRTQHSDAWRAAHRHLYEHLCKTTSDKKPNPTLEDLQPLYQAVAHGCQAGLQQKACQEIYFGRILRGSEYYSSKKLAALGSNLGAVACFFEIPWGRVSPAITDALQALLLNEAGYYLRLLGRLIEALEPLRAALKMVVSQQSWANASRCAANLSELEVTLGDVGRAVSDAEQSVMYADWGSDDFAIFMRSVCRSEHAE